MASPRKSERLISSRGHGCYTIGLPQLPATATRFPSHGFGRPGLELRTATKLSSVGFEPTAVLTFGLRVRRHNTFAQALYLPPPANRPLRRVGYLAYEYTGTRRWKIIKAALFRSSPIPENDTQSRSKIFLNNTLSFSFFGQSCAPQENLYEICRKLWNYCHPSDLNHIRKVQMALKRPFGVKNDKYGI